MVNQMTDTIKLDKQGRIIIPIEIREKLNLHEAELKINVIGKKIIIEPFNADLEQEVSDWESYLKSNEIKPFKIELSDEENESKWFSEGYAKQKLGL